MSLGMAVILFIIFEWFVVGIMVGLICGRAIWKRRAASPHQEGRE